MRAACRIAVKLFNAKFGLYYYKNRFHGMA